MNMQRFCKSTTHLTTNSNRSSNPSVYTANKMSESAQLCFAPFLTENWFEKILLTHFTHRISDLYSQVISNNVFRYYYSSSEKIAYIFNG